MTDELKKFPAPRSKEFKLESIEGINYSPHPYCITGRHILKDRMYLDETGIKEAEEKGAKCGMYISPNKKECSTRHKPGWQQCELPYNEHTFDRVLFIKALVNKEVKDLVGLRPYITKIIPAMKKLKIDGVAFIGPDKKKHDKNKLRTKQKRA